MSQHWYDTDGNPVYTIIGANGKERDTTLRDARKLNLVTSTTTPIGQINKPRLEKWKLEQAIDAAHRCRSIDDFDEFKRKVWDRYNENISVYSTKGTEVHDKLERYFKEGVIAEPDAELLIPAIDAIHGLGYDNYEAEESFTSPEGYGGKIDLILRSDNNIAVMDFKTKQGAELSSKSIYWDYIMQLAAYRAAVAPTADCYNLLISVTNPGIIYLHKHSEEDLQKGLRMFRLLLEYWKLNNNYMVDIDAQS